MIKFDIHKTYSTKNNPLHLHLTTTCEQGKIIAIYGNSGTGKSSLLRMLAGLTTQDKGFITIGEEDWFNSDIKKNIKANKRSIGFLFQDYSLFPNMSVRKNILYGVEKNTDQDLINRIIEIGDLQHLLDRKPESLSGGQQQRVALARAMDRKPKLLLLDEPLSALDEKIRIKLQKEILAINSLIKTTIILVSHSLPEVFKLADEVLLIENGSFVKKVTPTEIFTNEKTDLLGEFISLNEDEKILKVMVEGKIVNVNLPNAK